MLGEHSQFHECDAEEAHVKGDLGGCTSMLASTIEPGQLVQIRGEVPLSRYLAVSNRLINDIKSLTGLLVVPEVYSIIPAWSMLLSSSWIDLCGVVPPNSFSNWLTLGVFFSSPLTTSSALERNLADESSMKASLLSRMYLSSVAGKPEESGTAMELLPSTDNSVTEDLISSSNQA